MDPPVEVARDKGTMDPPSSAKMSSSPVPSAQDTAESSSSNGPKFQPKQRVYAKDASCGLWYEAVIRRSLFGIKRDQKVQIGLVSNESEIEELLQSTDEPIWHFFVHYNGWNVKWDRWVSEEDVMEDNEESKRIAGRFAREHKELQKTFRGNKKGKASRSSDGAAFLKAWRERMDQIVEEMQKDKENDNQKPNLKMDQGDGFNSQGKRVVSTGMKAAKEDATVATSAERKTNETIDKSSKIASVPTSKSKPKRKSKPAKIAWDQAAIDKEFKLRLRGLEGKKCSTDQYKITLPFSLKKVMVEAWEIITQCQMVANVPAKITVRQALDKYLQSKLDLIANSSPRKPSPAKSPLSKQRSTTQTALEELHPVDEEELKRKRSQEWKDMVEGIAMFFDEALSFRLLYSQELAQYKVVESTFEVPIPDAAVTTPKKSYDNIPKGEMVGKDDAMACASSPAGDTTPTKMSSAVNNMHVTAADSIKKEAPVDSNESTPSQAPASAANSTEKESVEQSTKSTVPSDVGKPVPKTRPMLPSEVYGCEHLLRFFLKVPDVLAEQQSQLQKDDREGSREALDAFEKETKQVLAKINDLIRFLHKHQATMFADSYRKFNEAELREQQKLIKYVERKRRRATEQQEAASNGATDPTAAGSASLGKEEADTVAAKLQKVN
ncbi:Mortality factor 4-like protein [Seminavis robusta]|uniref:Mortality factor 4-like protein n=1 Tax=Seminavis robusta TaxID=568900 RepID=A0A9N8EDF2_9STRA|nr:Mortality factor 4-like protein [Seminavis robusta]|eukprot:Sro988_g228320.1 Mortality factor 4-like protein (666) ;mRNA; r:7265-9262